MEEKREDAVVFMTGADILQDAEECDLTEEFLQKTGEKASQTILDETQLRRQEDWSLVANQVVGGEHIAGRP